MIIDLGTTAVDPEANATVDVLRKSGGAYNQDGEWEGEVQTVDSFLCVLQPPTGRMLKDLPEGERHEAKFFLWTQSDLATDDIVFYGGSQYRVMVIWDRRSDGGYLKAALGLLRG